jgi:hypothetical protein
MTRSADRTARREPRARADRAPSVRRVMEVCCGVRPEDRRAGARRTGASERPELPSVLELFAELEAAVFHFASVAPPDRRELVLGERDASPARHVLQQRHSTLVGAATHQAKPRAPRAFAATSRGRASRSTRPEPREVPTQPDQAHVRGCARMREDPLLLACLLSKHHENSLGYRAGIRLRNP